VGPFFAPPPLTPPGDLPAPAAGARTFLPILRCEAVAGVCCWVFFTRKLRGNTPCARRKVVLVVCARCVCYAKAPQTTLVPPKVGWWSHDARDDADLQKLHLFRLGEKACGGGGWILVCGVWRRDLPKDGHSLWLFGPYFTTRRHPHLSQIVSRLQTFCASCALNNTRARRCRPPKHWQQLEGLFSRGRKAAPSQS